MSAIATKHKLARVYNNHGFMNQDKLDLISSHQDFLDTNMLKYQEQNIYLIGMMGCGKSTIGPLLAAKLGYSFSDTDMRIEAKIGQSISTYFSTVGKQKFRTLETEILAEVSTGKRLVISTGGGIAIEQINWSYLGEGLTIWLDPSVDLLVERLNHDTTRPILANCGDLRAHLERISAERRHSYAQAKIHLPILQKLASQEILDRLCALLPQTLS
jgi:shikimate kinase